MSLAETISYFSELADCHGKIMKTAEDCYADIESHAKKYETGVSNTIEKITHEMKDMQKLLNDKINAANSLGDSSTGDIITTLIDLTTTANEIETYIRGKLTNFITNPKWAKYRAAGMSQTYLKAANTRIAIFKQTTEILPRAKEKYSDTIDRYLKDIIKNGNPAELANIVKDVAVNDTSIAIMNILIETDTYAGKLILGKLSEMKKNALSVENDKLDTNIIMSRFGVFPTSEYMSKAEIRQIIGIENFKNIPPGIGIITINKYTDSPKKYRIYHLLSKANKKTFFNGAGLSKATLADMMTISKFNAPRPEKDGRSIITNTKFIRASSERKLYVIESVNNRAFRFLSDRIDSLTVSPSIGYNISRGISSKPEAYNSICEKALFERGMNNSYMSEVNEYMSMKMNAAKHQRIKETAIDGILKIYDEFAEKTPPTTLKKFTDISRGVIKTHEFEDAFTRAFTQDTKANMIITSRINSAIKQFKKVFDITLKEKIETGISENSYSIMTKSELHVTIRDLFATIIKTVADDMDIMPSYWSSEDMSLSEFSNYSYSEKIALGIRT